MRTILRSTVLCAALLGACGGDSKPPQRGVTNKPKKDPASPEAGGGAKPAGGGGAAPAGAKGKPPVKLQTYAKVVEEYRRKLEKADFSPDPTGDVNRDPFRSYLIDLSQVTGKGKKQGEQALEDECEEKGVVAENYGLRDLRLVGIVLRGTKTYAMFTDNQNRGHIANRGNCLSKERARVKDIGTDRVTLEIRGQAPPGAPAPAPREEQWLLDPNALDLDMESGGGFR
jgi:hypothetical protein